jgi:glyoxylase-like metal-dependent hydrolase (beta-lactamase superfamily II)
MAHETSKPGERFEEFFSFYIAHGFPEEELKNAMKNHPGYRYSPRRKIDFTVVREGDSIGIGDYEFTCIETPGHSPGHVCLYEKKKKILISGDHILFDITPNITYWPELNNSLKAYLESLEKVSTLNVALVLPGHRNTWNEHKRRIRELQNHHRERLTEALMAVEKGAETAWEVAPQITWDIAFKSWEQFPAVQKWFALGETIAHLNYLEGEEKIRRTSEKNGVRFAPA